MLLLIYSSNIYSLSYIKISIRGPITPSKVINNWLHFLKLFMIPIVDRQNSLQIDILMFIFTMLLEWIVYNSLVLYHADLGHPV